MIGVSLSVPSRKCAEAANFRRGAAASPRRRAGDNRRGEKEDKGSSLVTSARIEPEEEKDSTANSTHIPQKDKNRARETSLSEDSRLRARKRFLFGRLLSFQTRATGGPFATRRSE